MSESAHITLTLSAVEAALGVRGAGGAGGLTFSGISTDSRTAGNGDLFVALEGDRFDGHDFIPDAIKGGASGIVVSASRGRIDVPAGVAVFAVADTLHALGELARHHRGRLSARIVGITGSNGKTTTKQIAASIAGTVMKTVYTEGNLNNLIGMPMTLLSAPTDTEALILEMGMNVPGEVERLAAIAAPDIGVVTNVGPVHLEGVGSIDGVITEKGALLGSLPKDGIAVFEGDTDYTESLGRRTRAKRLTFGLSETCVVRAEAIDEQGEAGTRATFVLPGGSFSARLPLPGIHNLKNALAAAAAGHALGIENEKIKKGIESVSPIAMRMEIRTGTGGIVILNDSYNANPVSMRAALGFLARYAKERRGRAVAVLGDMLELGDFCRAGHEEVGTAAADAGVGLLFVLGNFSSDVRRGALSAGKNGNGIFTYPAGGHDALIGDLRQKIGAGDVVLVKGSRGMRMERVAHAIIEQ